MTERLTWRPIDTAPKGLVVWLSDGAQRTIGLWREGRWVDAGLAHGLSRNAPTLGWSPTYWMPLPPPPTTQEPAAEERA